MNINIASFIQTIILCLLSYTIGWWMGDSCGKDYGYSVISKGTLVQLVFSGIFYGFLTSGGFLYKWG